MRLDPEQTGGPLTAAQVAEIDALLATDAGRAAIDFGGGIVYRTADGLLVAIDKTYGARPYHRQATP